jgi:DNA-binding transcriptional ArsR family regulator
LARHGLIFRPPDHRDIRLNGYRDETGTIGSHTGGFGSNARDNDDMAGTRKPSAALLPTDLGGVEMVAKFFRAVGDPARLRLLEFLLTEEHTVSECVESVGLSQGRVSVHLACLSDCGYVVVRREGRFAYYKVRDPR